MTDYENLMKRCQRGATNLNDANNLLAECYGMLGKVKEIVRIQAENEALRKDAERYRWLRDSDDAAPFFSEWGIGQGDGALFEHALDRVMRGEEPWNDIATGKEG